MVHLETACSAKRLTPRRSPASFLADDARLRTYCLLGQVPEPVWQVCPALTGVVSPQGRKHAVLLRMAADDLLAQPFAVQGDCRNAHALRLWADRIEAEIETESAA